MLDVEVYYCWGLNRTPLAPDIGIDMYKVLKTDSMLVLRKNSPVLRESKNFFEAMQHYADINGIRSRYAVRTVDVKFEIWTEAEKYLFSYD